MSFKVTIVADSISEFYCRLITLEATYPRFIHSEIMTHRDRARNAASSRAIPWFKMMQRINENPVIPIVFGREQKGMQTGIPVRDPDEAERIWLEARDNAVRSAQALTDLGVHKSICNRITEPWMWITTIMTATSWKNFFRLRVHPDAEIHFQKIAGMIQKSIEASQPEKVGFGNWHLPYIKIDEVDNPIEDLKKASVARCARVSYLTHDNQTPNIENDLKLFDRLVQGSGFGHWSPHEHVATPVTPDVQSGPFKGWLQYRKFFPGECENETL